MFTSSCSVRLSPGLMHVLLFLVRQMHPCSACKLCRTDKLFHVCVHVLILKGKLEVVRFSGTAGARFSCAPLPSLTLLLFTHSLTLASSGGLNRKHPLGLNVFGREAAAPPPSCEAPLCLCAPSGLSAGRAVGRSVGPRRRSQPHAAGCGSCSYFQSFMVWC